MIGQFNVVFADFQLTEANVPLQLVTTAVVVNPIVILRGLQ